MADTTVNLNVSAGGQAQQQMQDLAKATNDAAKATQQLTAAQAQAEARNRIVKQQNEQLIRSQTDLARQSMGQPMTPGASGGGGGMGFLKGAGLTAGALVGAIKLAGAMAPSVAAANDSTLSPERRNEAMRESLPVIGGLIKGLRELKEAADGTTNKLKVMQQNFEIDMQEIAIRAQAYREADSIGAKSSGLSAQAYAQGEYANAKGRPVSLGTGWDQSTVAGERALDQARRRLPLEMEARQAKLGSVAAGVDVMNADREVANKQRRYNQAKENSDKAIGAVGGASGKVERLRAEQGVATTLNELEERRKDLAAARERQQAAIGASVQAESAHRKALIGIDRERLSVLAEQEQRIKGAAQSFGALSEAEKTEAVEVANRAKQQGFGSLTPEQKALLSRAGAGDFVAKGQENLGLADDRFKQIQDAVGEKADLKGVQKQRVELENKVAIDVQLDQKRLALDMKEQLEPVLTELYKLAAEQARISTNKIIQNLRLKNLAQ